MERPSDTRSGDMDCVDVRGVSSRVAMRDGFWGKGMVAGCGASKVSEWSGFGR